MALKIGRLVSLVTPGDVSQRSFFVVVRASTQHFQQLRKKTTNSSFKSTGRTTNRKMSTKILDIGKIKIFFPILVLDICQEYVMETSDFSKFQTIDAYCVLFFCSVPHEINSLNYLIGLWEIRFVAGSEETGRTN